MIPRFPRHRGHRYISIRQLDNAISDFEHAASMIDGQPNEIEPDGMPNARGIPVSTLQGQYLVPPRAFLLFEARPR